MDPDMVSAMSNQQGSSPAPAMQMVTWTPDNGGDQAMVLHNPQPVAAQDSPLQGIDVVHPVYQAFGGPIAGLDGLFGHPPVSHHN